MLYPICFNGLYGYINSAGSWVINPVYEKTYGFSSGLGVAHQGKKSYVFNASGQLVLELDFRIDSFSEGLARFRLNQKYGFVDLSGQIRLQNLPWADHLQDGLVRVKSSQGNCFYNSSGELVIDSEYADTGSFSEGLAPFLWKEKWGYMDQSGDQVISLVFDMASPFRCGLALIRQGDVLRYCLKDGSLCTEEWVKATNFDQNVALVFKTDWQILHKDGKTQEIEHQKEILKVAQPAESCSRILTPEGFVFLNLLTRQYLPGAYFEAFDFQGGLARIIDIDGNEGYLNRAGETIIPQAP